MEEREITIYDVARVAYYSPATVSRALRDEPCIHEETKRKINKIALELGYRPNNFASNLRKNRTNSIGVLVNDLSDACSNLILSGVQKGLSDANYDIILSNSAASIEKEAANLTHLFNKRVDGLILISGCQYSDFSQLNDFIKKRIPIVVFDQNKLTNRCIRVSVDDYKAGYDAALHLINKGCRNIMHITGDLKRPGFYDRWSGFRSALSDFKLPNGERQLIISDLKELSMSITAQNLLGMKGRPDGLFVSCDLCAAICVREFILNGMKVPDDIKVIGFNNDVISRISRPQLSTISYPAHEMGVLGAHNLLRQLKNKSGKNSNRSVVLTAELVERGSTQKETCLR